jgi:heme-degrading monooxygenase HmoA
MSRAPLPPLFEPPYWAVVFASQRTAGDQGYGAMAEEMERLVAQQPGYLGMESARDADGVGITVAYFRTEADARAWKQVGRHLEAQRLGREKWYRGYRVRVAKVEREYGFEDGENL